MTVEGLRDDFASSTEPEARSWWLLEDAEYDPSPPLLGSTTADVAVVGGGYTGLWTALFLREADPSLDVVVLEQEIVGYGASGRNAGFAMTALGHSLHHLVKNHGVERARAAHLEVARSVLAIGEFSEKHGIDCQYEPSGSLRVANGDGQVGRVMRDLEAAEQLGLDDWSFLDRDAVRAEVDSSRFACGSLERTGALLNPARLVRGVKRVAVRKGVRVFERTPVNAVRAGPAVRLETPRGTVTAQAAVLATNAWSHRWKPIGLRGLPLYTYVLLSEPLSPDQRELIGWWGRQGVEDKQNYLHYFRLTPDDRLLWGGEARYFYGPSVGLQHDRDRTVFATLVREFRITFPQLHLRFEFGWGGPIAVTTRFVPTFGRVRGTGVFYGFGYSGHGVAPSHLGGQILRDLVLERETALTDLFLVAREKPVPRFPPEPLAFLAERVSRSTLKRQDARMAAGKNARDFGPLILRLLNPRR